MGKAGETEQAASRPAAATSRGCWYRAAICKIVKAKCVSVFLLSVGGFISALFLLLHFRASGAIPDDPETLAEIQAGFILLMPYSELASHVGMLEKDIYKDLGVPNIKVSVSMHPYTYTTNSTYVTFNILPDPRNSSITPASTTELREYLIQLTLQRCNLNLTPSVFGDPFCLEILGFPGGINMWFPHSIQCKPKPIFNMTLNSTIHRIKRFFEDMEFELGSTLKKTPYEELFVKLRNNNGSTVAVPVLVQVSISSSDHNIYQDLDRLKELAQIIQGWKSTNLGLNISTFGKIRDLKLYPALQDVVHAFAPSLPPASEPSITWPPSWDHRKMKPNGSFSCPDSLVKKQNAKVPYRKLSQRFHRKYQYGGKMLQ